LLFFILLNTEPFVSLISDLVGADFLNKNFPVSVNGFRCTNPLLLFGFTILFMILLDALSLRWYDSVDLTKISEMEEEMIDLYHDGKGSEGRKMADKAIQKSLDQINNEGILTQLSKNKKIVAFIDFFGKKQ